MYDTVAVYSTTNTISGDYSGRAHRRDYRTLVVLVKRQGRWQQVATQLTRIEG